MLDEINMVAGTLFKQKKTGIRAYKKGQILQSKGDRNSRLFFVKKGLVRSYDIDKNGKVHTFMFAISGQSIYDPNSLNTNKPSELFLDVIEDSLIETINLKLLDTSSISSKSKDVIISMLNTSLCELQNRVIKMMSASTYERYEFFLQKYPDIANRIPQWMIASYLGITPEALSNVKGKYYRQLRSA
ncbi:MAG: cyclic nucleotide-binding domain-containing protein [Bacteroidota bacterium]